MNIKNTVCVLILLGWVQTGFAQQAEPVQVQPVENTPASQSAYVYRLNKGESIDRAFQEWAEHAGWVLEWKLPWSWRIPASVSYGTNFEQAITQAIESIYAEGVQIKLRIYEGNRVMQIMDYAGN